MCQPSDALARALPAVTYASASSTRLAELASSAPSHSASAGPAAQPPRADERRAEIGLPARTTASATVVPGAYTDPHASPQHVHATAGASANWSSASARGAKASSSRAGFASSEQLRASAFSLLTEHDPLTVGVYLFGGALCSAAALMVFICVASGSRAAREAAVA